jgi:hypothetical protein
MLLATVLLGWLAMAALALAWAPERVRVLGWVAALMTIWAAALGASWLAAMPRDLTRRLLYRPTTQRFLHPGRK